MTLAKLGRRFSLLFSCAAVLVLCCLPATAATHSTPESAVCHALRA